MQTLSNDLLLATFLSPYFSKHSFRTFYEGFQFLVTQSYILVLQVVLLGDHKQLRPIVKNEHARRLGMTRSLFERYMDRALLLDTQYRMVQDKHIYASHSRLHTHI